MSTQRPFFSIVIPTLNEEKCLPLLLQDLSDQKFKDFEVIVVDAKSKDKTLTKGEQFLSLLQLSLFSITSSGVSEQRNYGAQKSKADWIIFMDADNQVPADFLAEVKKQLQENPETDLFTTWMDSKVYTTKEEKIISQTYNWGLDIYKYLRKPTAVGALLGIKKDLFTNILFNKNLKVFEDHDLVQRAVSEGHTFSIFHNPQYCYSFRRFQKEGTLKMIAIFISLNVSSLIGSDTQQFEKFYPMKGGEYYAILEKRQYIFISNLQKLLKQTSRTQLQRVRAKISALLNNAINS